MATGFIVGIIRMIIDFSYKATLCGEPDTRPSILRNLHYFYFALILFLLTGMLCIVISLLMEPLEDKIVSLRLRSSAADVLQNTRF